MNDTSRKTPLVGMVRAGRLGSIGLRIFFAGLVVVGMFAQCTRTIAVDKYEEFFKKNNGPYTARRAVSDVVVEVTYCPPEVYASRELQFDSTRTLAEALAPYQRSLFLVVSIKGKDQGPSDPALAAGGQSQYSGNVIRNTFLRQNDFCIVCGSDTIVASGYSFERSWWVTRGDAYVLTFDRTILENRMGSCTLLVRNITETSGTIEIKLSSIVKPVPRLKTRRP